MTIIAVDSVVFFADMFLCAGLGVWLSFVYHMCTLFFKRKSRLPALLFHIGYFALGAGVVFLFVIGQTTTKDIRWFIIAGLGLGAAVYYGALACWALRLRALIKQALIVVLGALYQIYYFTLGWLVRLLWRVVGPPLKRLGAALRGRLQNARGMLYNSLTKRARDKTGAEGVENGPETTEQRRKKASKPVTKT